MKKNIFITLLIGLFALALNAQETAPELYNAGKTAYTQKDYTTAIEKWEAYLAHPDAAERIEATNYNIAEAARKAGKQEVAEKYYAKCIALEYKADLCTFKTGSFYKSSDPEKYIMYMEKCVTDYPNSKYYKKYFLPSVTNYYNKAAADIFNKANAEAQVATASGDAEVYVSKMKSTVLPLFNEAEAAFKKTLEFDPEESKATSAISSIETQREAFATYLAEIAAQQKK